MLAFLQQRWFLIALGVLIPGGLIFGANGSAGDVRGVIGVFPPRFVTAIVLFLMAFSLNSARLGQSLRAPGPVAWAVAVNFGLIPLLAWLIMPLQVSTDFALGLMIVAAAPCTMAAASVWTRKAGGNDAVALLVTVATNGLCFLLTPMWLKLTTARDVNLDAGEMFSRLLQAVLLPMVAGQLIRQIPAAGRFATRFKTQIGTVAQACILTLVFSSACRGGLQLQSVESEIGAGSVVIVWLSCIAVHLLAMGTAVCVGRFVGFSREDWTAAAFASSQKTLPIALLVATDPAMFGDPDLLGAGVGVPFAVFPTLMYHASQLFIDTFVADRLRAGAKQSEVHAGEQR